MSVVASRRCTNCKKEVSVITIGIDPHTRTHSAAALDEGGRIFAEITVGSDPPELDRLVRWVEGIGPERIVAVEGARGFGLALCRRLLGAGETVLDLASALTASERRSGRKAGKDDRGDAVAVARIAMRKPGLPRVSASVIGSELKLQLLVEARDQLVERGDADQEPVAHPAAGDRSGVPGAPTRPDELLCLARCSTPGRAGARRRPRPLHPRVRSDH